MEVTLQELPTNSREPNRHKDSMDAAEFGENTGNGASVALAAEFSLLSLSMERLVSGRI